MRILIVNKGLIPVKLYGGTERVIWYLGKELAKLGHKVTYLVKAGSVCDFGSVIPIDESKDILEQIPEEIDLVHFNFTPENLKKIEKPYLITIHGNSNDDRKYDQNSVFVSQNHASRYGSDSFVYNGLDWSDYQKPDWSVQREYFHFLGKAAWRVKNVKGAIDVIKQTKSERLNVLGGQRFNFNMGLRLTFSSRVNFFGMVGGAEKDKLINGSKGLLFPVRWHEPFGLAIIESLYYGCPVFGTPYGSLPEIVNQDVGLLSDKLGDLVDAINGVNAYSRKLCHKYTVEMFNSKKMALSYLEKYERILSKEKLNDRRPQIVKIQAEKFLNWE